MPFGIGALGSLIGAGLPIASALFGNKKSANPSNAAAPYLNQIPGIGQKYYNPFIERGQQAENELHPKYQQWANNPMGYLNEILGGYKPSPYNQYRTTQGLQGAHAAAASTGLTGTPSDIASRTELVNQITSQGMEDFLKNVLGIQSAGVTGLENQSNRGFLASTGLADYLGNANYAQGGNAAYGRGYKGEGNDKLFQALGGLNSSLFGNNGIFGKAGT